MPTIKVKEECWCPDRIRIYTLEVDKDMSDEELEEIVSSYEDLDDIDLPYEIAEGVTVHEIDEPEFDPGDDMEARYCVTRED